MRVRTRLRTQMLVASLATLAVLLAAAPAGATQASDPEDVSGKLDLKQITATKADATAPLHITIVTYENWKKKALSDSGHNRVFVLFNTDSDSKAEYVGEIYESGGNLVMVITGSGSAFEPLPVRHPNGHTLKTVVPGSSPPNPDGNVGVAAKSRYTDAGDCATACKDRAPNGGWLTVP